MVLAADGRKANDSHSDCYQYFCVPEYGTAHCRLHFRAVQLMRTLPTGCVDPNVGRPADGRKSHDSRGDCYQYSCVPEYGTANGRLHLHEVHFMRKVATGSVDPNFGHRVLNFFFFKQKTAYEI